LFVDSIDKIFTSYVQGVCRSPVLYKGRTLTPKPPRISSGLFRGFDCPENCAGCCPRFSLDYLPFENRPDSSHIQEREILVNDKLFTIFSDLQDDHTDHFCRYVDKSTGRCKIHGLQPFSCDFELIRFCIFKNKDRPNVLNQRKFGRGWSFLRPDGKRGALCKLHPATSTSISGVVRKLTRLFQ